MSLSEKMINFRARNKLTQKELAAAIGLARKTIIKAEKGLKMRPIIEQMIVIYIENNK